MAKIWFGLPGRLAVIALLAGLLAACGGGGARPAAAPAPVGVGSAPSVADSAAKSPAQSVAPAASAPRPAGPSVSSPSTALGAPVGVDLSQNDRKIILNADLSLKVENAREAMQAIQEVANFSRGWVSDANLTGSDDAGWTVKMVLKVPAGNFADALDRVRKLGEVKGERQWSQDVTDTYIDLNARLTTLQEYEQRLRELALKANGFDEWLKLTQQINETRTQIESLTGRLRVLNNQVEFSTFNISLSQPPVAGKPKAEVNPVGLGQRIANAFRESGKAMLQIGEGFLVFLAGFLPVGVVLGILFVLGWAGYKAWRQRNPRPTAPPPPTGGSA